MKASTEPSEPTVGAGGQRRRRWLLALLLLLVGVGLAAPSRDSGAFAAPDGLGSAESAAAVAAQEAEPDYSRFAHTSAAHSRLPCLTCHRREDSQVQPNRPGHRPCSACHSQKFAELRGPICTNCHTSAEPKGGDLKKAPTLNGFSVKFDHARHPSAGCATCHKTINRGVALSIPSGAAAHATCYECHALGKEAANGGAVSCNTCHDRGSYSRFAVAAKAYKVSFSHAAHSGRQKLSCNECHRVRNGAPPQDQVSRPVPLMHHASGQAQSCITCHNNKRAFGTDNFADCKRCHQGSTFSFR